MANGHGGARPGAGRKRKHDKYRPQITQLEDQIADRLLRYHANLEVLADGGFEQVEEVYEPAGLVQVERAIETKDGTVRSKEAAFPHLPPDQLVCVRRRVTVAAPDRAANIYLIDRIVGKTAQQVEVGGELEVGGTIGLTLADWKTTAEQRIAAAQATLALLDGADDVASDA